MHALGTQNLLPLIHGLTRFHVHQRLHALVHWLEWGRQLPYQRVPINMDSWPVHIRKPQYCAGNVGSLNRIGLLQCFWTLCELLFVVWQKHDGIAPLMHYVSAVWQLDPRPPPRNHDHSRNVYQWRSIRLLENHLGKQVLQILVHLWTCLAGGGHHGIGVYVESGHMDVLEDLAARCDSVSHLGLRLVHAVQVSALLVWFQDNNACRTYFHLANEFCVGLLVRGQIPIRGWNQEKKKEK